MKAYRQEGELVTLRLSRADFQTVLLALGNFAANQRISYGDTGFYRVLNVANRINEGNRNWTPYEMPEEFR